MTKEENIITDTICLNSTKSDWDTAPEEDKNHIVEYCTDRLNFKTGNSFESGEIRELVDKLFSEAAIDTTTFLEIMTDSYKSFRENVGDLRS